MFKIFNKKISLIAVTLLLLTIIIGAIIYLRPYPATQEALMVFQQKSDDYRIEQKNDWYKFEPTSDEIQSTIILYPGGLVKPESYSLLAEELALNQHRVFIIKMPLNLAFLGQDKANPIVDKYQDEPIFIGGHSLGAVFASRFALEFEEKLDGVFFLASYPDKKGSLRSTSLPSILLTASEDKVINKKNLEQASDFFSKEHHHFIIEGGNHAYFGSYGQQSGDGESLISTEVQRRHTVMLLHEWINDHLTR
ncbi:alpha/beta hydrolase [Alkalihalobacillus sp. 1P02AB]|uniref:alpha/beta hydrolase n=1 Tax=Alkalihalobacillus sp. 1P02AB TaxID=3132260 RepID=UPI0039A5C872